jgi:hypothetical protein
MTYDDNARQFPAAVDLDRLSDEIRRGGNGGQHEEDYASPRTPLPPLPTPTQDIPRFGMKQHNTIQVIGHAITRLTWSEAEKMGTGIQIKMKEGVTLAAAIQAWAAEWEKFE